MRPMLQRIDDVPEPVVGHYYLVPCLQAAKPGLWLPIIGPEHEDAAIIKFPALHCHYDLRFFSKTACQQTPERLH